MSTATDRAHASSCCDDPDDADWGRLPGAAPPLAWWWPGLVFTVAAVVLAVVVTLVVRGPGLLDDPAPADQRDGLLLDGPALPREVAGVVFGARPVVLLFDRAVPQGPAFDDWKRTVDQAGADLVVLTPGPRAAELADAVGMPTPVDGGPPVGYAVVDPSRTVRYATLDPAYLINAFEVDVIVRAVDA
jgi:hypothetical protein